MYCGSGDIDGEVEDSGGGWFRRRLRSQNNKAPVIAITDVPRTTPRMIARRWSEESLLGFGVTVEVGVGPMLGDSETPSSNLERFHQLKHIDNSSTSANILVFGIVE
jgi:hypothetical protein